MPRTFIRPETQIKTLDTFDDTVASGSTLETTTWNMEQFLQGVISQLNRFLNTTTAGNDWYAGLTAPTTFESGAARGIDDLNQDLHDTERKRVLRSVANLTDIGPLGSVQVVVLTLAQLPANTTAAIGSVTTLGTVAATATTFATAGLDEVAGSTAIAPKNICEIVDASTRDPILDASGRRVWALFQTESSTDGSTMTGTTPNRAQLSFVVVNSTGDDLELVAAADMNGKSINYASVERVGLRDLNEQDFLRGAIVDVPSGSTVTRQVAYDNQGTTPVDVTTASYLDLEGAGLVWQIRDDAEAVLFGITENSGTSASTITFGADVDVFDNDAVLNNFLNGASFDTGAAGTTINVGVTANTIDSGGALTVQSGGAGNLLLDSTGGEIEFDDSYRGSSTYSVNLRLADSATEWTDFDTAFGEVSLLAAIVAASESDNRNRATATVSSAIPANTLIEGPNGPGTQNISADLLDYRNVTFVDDVEIFINGQLMLNGADAAANNDVYPSATATPDQQYGCFYAEFALKSAPGNADVIQMFITGAL